MRRVHAGIAVPVLVILVWGVPPGRAQTVTTYSTSFETGADFSGWQLWYPLSLAGCSPNPGPNALFLANNHPHTGQNCARQESGNPGWWGSLRVEPSLANTQDDIIDLSVWQFEDFSFKVPDASHGSHDQNEGWLAIMDGDGNQFHNCSTSPVTPTQNPTVTEFFALGVHCHRNSPAPVLDWWQHYAYGTTTDGWHTTTIPRAQGFHQFEIKIHPYTGAANDVEFFINGQLVGAGHRQPGNLIVPRGVQLTTLALGANHTLMTVAPGQIPGSNCTAIGNRPGLLDYLANTYEFFYYDDLQLQLTPAAPPCHDPRFDADGDSDVDMDDFGAFQRCYTGPTGVNFNFAACRCMNSNVDAAIDAVDFAAFEACASGAQVPAVVACDDALSSSLRRRSNCEAFAAEVESVIDRKMAD